MPDAALDLVLTCIGTKSTSVSDPGAERGLLQSPVVVPYRRPVCSPWSPNRKDTQSGHWTKTSRLKAIAETSYCWEILPGASNGWRPRPVECWLKTRTEHRL